MRISDWSSDVCSSDLANARPQLKNAAAVMVTADLPPFAKPGQTIDVTVASIGNAKSIRGGQLLMAPLRGADGNVYAVAQRSEEHTSELQSLMRISYAVFCLKKNKTR